MTLGEGLPAESTFAHQFQSIQSAYRSEILAFHGWSPSILLRLVEQPELAALKASPKGQDIAIFGFIDHHLIRTVAGTALGSSLRLSGQNTNAADGRYLGPFKKVHPWLFIGYSIYLNALKSSILARGIFPELPLYDKDHIDLLANVFLRLKESVNARLGIPDFRVLIFPHSRIGRLLTSRLHDRGIQTINWGAVAIENHVANVYLPYDNHFSAESHRAIAENLKQLLAPTPHPH